MTKNKRRGRTGEAEDTPAGNVDQSKGEAPSLRCKADAFSPGPGGGWMRCRCPAKRDGFCGIHHPDTVARREARARETAKAHRSQAEDRVARHRNRDDLRKAAELLAEKLETGELVCTLNTADGMMLEEQSTALDALAKFLGAADRLRECWRQQLAQPARCRGARSEA